MKVPFSLSPIKRNESFMEYNLEGTCEYLHIPETGIEYLCYFMYRWGGGKNFGAATFGVLGEIFNKLGG